MPTQIVIEIPREEPAHWFAELRHARCGRWLALPIVLLLARHHSPSEIAVFLLGARSTVYRVAQEWQPGGCSRAEVTGAPGPPCLSFSVRRSLLALLQKTPAGYGWSRTRWSGAPLALPLQVQRGIGVSGETVRRGWHALGWVWKRAKLVAKDSDPERALKLARIRLVAERLGPRDGLLFADELDLQLLPKVGSQWMPQATQVEVMTPGKNERRYRAGALDLHTGQVHHCLWFRKLTGLFLDLLNVLDRAYCSRRFDRIDVVADHGKIHQAAAVPRWLQQHPRFHLLFLPTDCPRAHPIERCFGDRHDKVTRNHRRKRMGDLVHDVHRHLAQNGPWRYRLSEIYQSVEVTKALQKQTGLPSPAVA